MFVMLKITTSGEITGMSRSLINFDRQTLSTSTMVSCR